MYNFFAAKVDLLSALLYEEVRVRLKSSLPDTALSNGSPRDGLLALVTAQVKAMASLPKTEQKLVVARSILAGSDSEAGRYSAEIDRFMRTAIRDLIADYLTQGSLGPDIDPDVAAGLIYAILNTLYMEWLQTETEFQDVVPVVADYLDLVLRP